MVLGWDDLAIGAASAIGSGMLGNLAGMSGNKQAEDRIDYTNQATLNMMGQEPLAQKNGLIAAGINPMVQYMGAAGPTYASSVSAGSVNVPNYTGDAVSAFQASTARDVATSTIELQTNTAKKTLADAGLSENALQMSNAAIDAISRKMGHFAMTTNLKDDALTRYLQKVQVDPEVQQAAMQIAQQKNEEHLAKFMNTPATNTVMEILQTLVKIYRGLSPAAHSSSVTHINR